MGEAAEGVITDLSFGQGAAVNGDGRRGRLSHQFSAFLFAILLINTAVAVAIAAIHFNNAYVSLMQARVDGVGNNLKNFMEEVLGLGLPIGSLEGVEKELEKNATPDLNASYLNVVDEDSRIIYSFPEIRKGRVFQAAQILPLIKQDRRKTFTTDSSYNTFSPIKDRLTGRVVGGINIGITKSSVYNQTLNTLTSLIVTFIIFILVTIATIYWKVKRTISPLEALTRNALALGKGNLSVRVKSDQKNEIGSLADSFNCMAEELQEAERRRLISYKQLQSAHEQILQREQKLKDAQAQMVLNEKMASLGVLIAGIAHEINTPAGAIANVTGELIDRLESISNAYTSIHDLSPSDSLKLRSLIKEFLLGSNGISVELQWKKSRELRKWLVGLGVQNEKEVLAVLTRYNLLDLDKMREYESLLKQPWTVELLDSFGTIKMGMQICESSIRKISEIVKALKYYAYTDMDKTSLVDINDSIENVLLLMNNRLKYTITVKRQFRPLPRIQCTSEISQVWTNLISNAVDAIGEAKLPEGKGMIGIETSEREGFINVKITDNGSGIPSENLGKMFDPFFTTKEIGHGTGLGLPIVSGIIKKHGGSISVESVSGCTAFTVSLPINADKGGQENE